MSFDHRLSGIDASILTIKNLKDKASKALPGPIRGMMTIRQSAPNKGNYTNAVLYPNTTIKRATSKEYVSQY